MSTIEQHRPSESQSSEKYGERALALRESLSTIDVGTIIYVLQRAGYFHCFMPITPVTPGATRFVGFARTLRTEPAREDMLAQRRGAPKSEDPHRIAIDELGSGEVLVVAARGNLDAGVAGDLLVQRIGVLGGAGLVTDGCVRDLSAIRDVGLPVFANGAHAATFPTSHLAVDVNVPVGCGGVLVVPGDLLVGDDEGIAVVPAALIDSIVEESLEQERVDSFTLAKIKEGVSLAQSYPLNETLRAEYEAQR